MSYRPWENRRPNYDERWRAPENRTTYRREYAEVESPELEDTKGLGSGWHNPTAKLWAGLEKRVRIRGTVEPFCESPIEADLAILMIERLSEFDGFKFAFCPQSQQNDFEDYSLLLIPQFKWQRYRMDFALKFEAPIPYVFVECDGKAFHSTEEQLQNDREKDAAAKQARIPLLRFTGSEIFRWDRDITDRVIGAVVAAAGARA